MIETNTNQTIKDILAHNEECSSRFVATIEERRQYREKYPTEFGVTKCMDGRIHLPAITQTPFGVLSPWRNLGGDFDIGWPQMGDSVKSFEEYAHGERCPCAMLITYHFSKGDRHRGCAGFNYDTEAAIRHAYEFKAGLVRAFGERIHPIIMGIETDGESLIIHGAKERKLDVERCVGLYGEQFFAEFGDSDLAQFLPDTPFQVRHDLMPLIQGNARHVTEIVKNGRKAIELVHNELVLAIGQGFDWLPRHIAIIIGPCDPNLDAAIIKGAKIIQNNRNEGRIPSDGVLLICNPFRKKEDIGMMAERSRFLARFAFSHIERAIPEMKGFFVPLVGVINMGKRKFIPVEEAV